MKPKAIVLAFSLAALVLTASWLNFGDTEAQAADDFEVEVVSQSELTRELEKDNEATPIWVVEGTAPAGGYLSCELEYADGRTVRVPMDNAYELGDNQTFRVTLFPLPDDWGATVRLVRSLPVGSLDELEPEVDRQVLVETVAPHHPAEDPDSGFIRRGEESDGYTVWSWRIAL